MNILIVSQYYFPEQASIPIGIATELTRRGHSVEVLTGYPNYPSGVIYTGYKMRWRLREEHGDVAVLRVPLYPNHSQSAAKRILNYASFAITSSCARVAAERADVIYVYATQMTAAFGPWAWSFAGGAPYVLHVVDLWPDSISASSLGSSSRAVRALTATLRPWMTNVYRRAAAVVGVTPSMVEQLRVRGVRAGRLHTVFNWADEQSVSEILRRSTNKSIKTRDVTNIVYAGNVGDVQDLETAVRAMKKLHGAGVRLTIVGTGVALPRIRELARQLGCTNIEFKEPVEPHRMAEVYASADYSLVTLKDKPVFHGTVPSKFQGSLAHGVPVITTVQGDARRLVQDLGVGFTSDAENPDALAQVFRDAHGLPESDRRAMAANATREYWKRFSGEAGLSAIEKILLNASDDLKGTS